MYTLLSMLPWRRIAYEQGPAFLIAWIIAELFYKFHSFSLEAAAFLATWFAIDAAFSGSATSAHAGQAQWLRKSRYHRRLCRQTNLQPQKFSCMIRMGCSPTWQQAWN